jgi:predicted NUDIX family NTP pyrophosphohydrolase
LGRGVEGRGTRELGRGVVVAFVGVFVRLFVCFSRVCFELSWAVGSGREVAIYPEVDGLGWRSATKRRGVA